MRQAEEMFEDFIHEDFYFLEHEKQPQIPLNRLIKLKEKLSEELYNEIEDLVYAASSAGEKQGFINGITYTYNKY